MIIALVFLLILNVLCSITSYYSEKYASAMFNAFVAGCLTMAIIYLK